MVGVSFNYPLDLTRFGKHELWAALGYENTVNVYGHLQEEGLVDSAWPLIIIIIIIRSFFLRLNP